ncbi:MAG TPA: phosphotransferase [Pyrinomonadaceae bacterium]|nr:phosphotransferase [Pyrinomonadaceae bacterium]
MNQPGPYEQRIRELFPELNIESISINREGLLNDAVVVNHELLFRFAKTGFGFTDPLAEAKVLHFLRKYITIQIPEPFYESEELLAYRLIPGETLRRDQLMKLAESDQQAIADQLAQFFKELHGIPLSDASEHEIPMADALMKYEGWVNVFRRIQEKVFPLLLPHVREWASEHFETYLADKRNFEYALHMIDSDIPPYHVLFDKQQRRISGIIDFGCAGLGDPAIDLGIIIYNYGESFLNRFYHVYPEAEDYVKRARFYAGAHEVRWLLTGIEKNNPWWFAVHVGSAKDMK